MNRDILPFVLKGQDLLVAFHLAATQDDRLAEIGKALGLSAAEVHNALARLVSSELVRQGSREVHRPHLIEFAIHGARFAFPPEMGRTARGIPTAQSAEPLASLLHLSGPEGHLVWKHPEGTLRAHTLEPIYRSAPIAALHNPSLHRKLALLDGIRAGGARVRELAKELLANELRDDA